MVFNLPVLANAVNDYFLRQGLGDTFGTGDFNNGIYFEYNRSVSVNWILKVAKNGIKTSLDSGIPVVTGWTDLKWSIEPNTGTVIFYINGVNAGSISAGFPNLPINACSPVVLMTRTLGNAQSIHFDTFILSMSGGN